MPYDFERFHIHSRSEIAGLLYSMQEEKIFLRMCFTDLIETVITRVLNVDMRNGRVFLSCAASPAQNRLVLQSHSIRFEAVTQRTKIAFRASRVRKVSYDGQVALVIDLPESIVRLQRREHVRIPVEGVSIRIALVPGEEETTITGRVCEMSIGGIALMDDALVMDDSVGACHRDCRLFLPDMSPVTVNIHFRHAMDMMDGNRLRARRIGYRLVELAENELAKIRRFVLETEQRMRMEESDN